ncbi:MAG TPA: DUF4352 domain-containing protein [Micromonosporaceae bacterium]
MRRLIIAGLAALALLLIGWGRFSGATQRVLPKQNPDAPTVNLGQTVTLDNNGNRAQVTVSDPQRRGVVPGPNLTATNGVYFVISVNVVCTGGTYHMKPVNFSLIAGNGTTYQASGIDFDPPLKTLDLTSGQSKSGKVGFDVPGSAIDGGKIQVNGVGLDSARAGGFWRL